MYIQLDSLKYNNHTYKKYLDIRVIVMGTASRILHVVCVCAIDVLMLINVNNVIFKLEIIYIFWLPNNVTIVY